MRSTHASAPSKLMLTGEYAVLDGAPAIVLALDRRTHARVRDIDRVAPMRDREGTGWIVHSDLDDRAYTLRPGTQGRLCLEDGTPARDVDATRLAALFLERLLRDVAVPPLEIRLSSASLRAGDGVTKLGLGSSASLSVALHAALTAHLARKGLLPLDPDPLRTVLECHRDLQGGRGSGADVAAATLGGVVRFVRTTDGALDVRPLTFPPALHWTLVWTGEAASTTSFLKALEAARAAPERAEEAKIALARLHALAAQAASAFEEGPLPRLLGVLEDYGAGLDALGLVIDRPIVSEAHRRLASLATSLGAVYKPSGAGGGDMGVIFADSATTLDSVSAAVSQQEYALFPVKVDPEGVTVNEEQ